MTLRLSGSMAICVLLAACGDKNSLSDLASNEFAAEIDQLGSLLDGMQKASDFGERLTSVAAKSPEDFMASLTKGMTDEAFIFKGVRFDGIKSKVGAKGKVLSSLQAKIAKTYKSPAGLFAAHGLGKKIDRSELAAYFTVAKMGLGSLATGKSPSQQLDSMTVARALHVAAALSAASRGGSAALALGDSDDNGGSFSGEFGACGSISNVAKEKSYICAKDSISGSIGYMSGDRSQWIDGVNGKEFIACNGDSKFVKNGWGWNPDPKKPNGGESCHVNVQSSDMPYTQKELDAICKAGSESAKTNQEFCDSKPPIFNEGEEQQAEQPAPKPAVKKTVSKKPTPTVKKPVVKKKI